MAPAQVCPSGRIEHCLIETLLSSHNSSQRVLKGNCHYDSAVYLRAWYQQCFAQLVS